mgnify:CR=1 FL=1
MRISTYIPTIWQLVRTMVVVAAQRISVNALSIHLAREVVPVEVMRLRVRHARERVCLCGVGLVRHVDDCLL